MKKSPLVLPKDVFEPEMGKFLELISDAQNTDIDIANLGYYSPAAIVSLLCALEKSRTEIPRKIICRPNSDGFKYFQRMDFFKHLTPNIEIPEEFERHTPVNFSPIIRIDKTSNEGNIAETIMATIWGRDILNETELPNINGPIQYAIGEIVRNVIQHSESHGYIASQYYPSSKIIRIGIADAGIGILESFRKNDSPYYAGTQETHLAMLQKAVKSEVSSKTHKPLPPYSTGHENKGVGLTMLRAISSLTYGHFLLASGDAISYKDGNMPSSDRNFSGFYQGTICSIAFLRTQLDKYPYNELRLDASKEIMDKSDINVDDMFI